MNRYKGAKCPYCEEKFTDTDDVVVCPECGAPHHRSCYMEHNQCFYHDEHVKGFNWTPPVPEIPEELRQECPSCHAINQKGQPFCTNCHTRLPVTKTTPHPQNDPFGETQSTNNFSVGEINGQELAAYIGNNGPYFIKSFSQLLIAPFQISWNFSACVFTHFYFFYRKLYVWGFLFMSLSGILSLPSMVYSMELVKSMAPEYLGVTIPYDPVLMQSMLELARNFNLFNLILHLTCGAFANKLILREAIKNILKARTISSPIEDPNRYYAFLYYKGRPSKAAVVVVLLTYMAVYFFFASYLSSLAIPYLS